MKLLVFFMVLCLWGFHIAQAQISEEDIWNDFAGWLERQQPNSSPGGLIRSYRASLLDQGISDEEANRRMGVVSNFVFARRKGVERLWDKVYAGSSPIFTQNASAVVVKAIEGRNPGNALDIGMGQGRNAIYLAEQGWDVTGFDPSGEAVRLAQSNADRAGVMIDALVARDDEFDYGRDQWDLIVMTYVRDLNQDDAKRFWRALKPGGIVVYENGADENNSVLSSFLRFQIIWFEDVVTTPDWNPENKIRLQRLIALKTDR